MKIKTNHEFLLELDRLFEEAGKAMLSGSAAPVRKRAQLYLGQKRDLILGYYQGKRFLWFGPVFRFHFRKAYGLVEYVSWQPEVTGSTQQAARTDLAAHGAAVYAVCARVLGPFYQSSTGKAFKPKGLL